MNTKILMTTSAIALGIAGLVLTFSPEEISGYFNLEASRTLLILLQILGAFYFAFAMLNWMTRSSLIGGIYNRPIAVANFTHLLIAGLALIKGLYSNPGASYILWIIMIIYIVFAIPFGVLLFRHPGNSKGNLKHE